MRIAQTLRILGLLLMIFSLTMVPPMLVEKIYTDGSMQAFYGTLLTSFALGLLVWIPFKNNTQELRTSDGFVIVVLFWMVFCLVGALPFYWSPNPNISFTDAFFESVSGITTTGSTVLNKLDDLPRSILFYRQQLQFLGGIGIIILAVAILPMLGIGGMQLFRAEMTGPVKDNKLTPRITQTAKAIWTIYSVMTILCLSTYWLGGMSFFDAICYSFSTVSTGGFAPHDTSMAYFESPYLKLIAIIFMFLSAISFNLHFWAFHRKKVGIYSNDPELRYFVGILFISFAVVWLTLIAFGKHQQNPAMLVDTLFQTVSMGTTTGLIATDFSLWPSFLPLMLLFCGVIGGCAGSTSGGLKVIRIMLLQKQGAREVHRLIHPHGQYIIKIEDSPVNPKVIEAIWGFFAIYFVMFTILLLLVMVQEQDFNTAYTAVIATFSNIGPGLGNVAYHFADLGDYTKWVLSFAMLVGRLEIFTILVLFSPAFWRR
jgi:trk system potassium uptake protein TrkH